LRAAVTDNLPTARSIDAGKGDRLLKDLKFRCAKCGSRLTDAVVMGKGGIGVQPWRHEAG
jgi:hypothetical protein